jgi:hypothetical protein
MAAAVSGLIFAGRARWSYWYSASKMCGVIVREYRSLILHRVEARLGGVEGTRRTFFAAACAGPWAAAPGRPGRGPARQAGLHGGVLLDVDQCHHSFQNSGRR